MKTLHPSSFILHPSAINHLTHSESFVDDDGMAWTVPEYSKSQIDRAGAILVREDIDLFAYGDALRQINNWRSSHNYPLNIFQDGLRKRARQIDSSCIVAQRIKRLSSITAKLDRYPKMRLSMMQDIGGCRAVMTSVDQVHELVHSFEKSSIKHKLHTKDDYIAVPQKSGYRGVHLVYRYHSDKKAKTYNGLKIEIQLRSLLQHAWATAVETVGTFIRQALKSSQGEEDWLRFFTLMGTAIAQREGSGSVPNTPVARSALQAELGYYINKLDVEMHLQAYGSALREMENFESDAHYFLLVLDPSDKKINITGYRIHDLDRASQDYIDIEAKIKDTSSDAVLVSVDSIYALRKAYPNYFLDTNLFVEIVKEAMSPSLLLTP